MLVQFWQPQHVEMTEESSRNRVFTSSWRRAGSDHAAVFNSTELVFLQIVETALVNNLPQKLIWRLCSIQIKLWHVDIIEEKDHLLS